MVLCEAEILAPSCHGGVDLLPKSVVAIIFWKVEFWMESQRIQMKSTRIQHSRLKQVCELGSLSLLP